MSHSASSKIKKPTNGHQHKKQGPPPPPSSSSSSSDEDDGPIRAPVQLKLEFVNSIMFRQWELAKKLCQFMLMYEPDNQQAKQYAPLIDYMLAQQEQGSSSSSSDDSSDDDDDRDSKDSSSSSSSSNEEEKDENDTFESQAQAPKPANASLTRHYTHRQ